MSTDNYLSISKIRLTSNPHLLPLPYMLDGARADTQNMDDNETGLAVTSTVTSYSPQPDNTSRPEFAIRLTSSRRSNVEERLEEDDDEPPKSIIHAPPGFNDFVGIPCIYV
ncbi:hypothetical protein BDV37DRAFT_234992 [Aspergillus pseudonomiae]|uniref:Uncharacterized protein n=1 Tax=Aspergillus pseudonomiae TaxID=1506151 RepID=A0A5N7CYR6_9EURO|nr:uncharacterized protein BDV37DRAFT_234992 [Aspergillus pseudonomiae]KAE8399340.1 hypothetical protein BDV37DRAFT_234992 [Aspergillus pseudonomiae]